MICFNDIKIVNCGMKIKEITRDVFVWYGYVKYCSGNTYTNQDENIKTLIKELKNYEPLEVK